MTVSKVAKSDTIENIRPPLESSDYGLSFGTISIPFPPTNLRPHHRMTLSCNLDKHLHMCGVLGRAV